MSYIVMISGSPSVESRTAYLLQQMERIMRTSNVPTRRINVSALPAEALLRANGFDAEIIDAVNLIREARAVVIGTPIYNAAYSGLLKTFLDVLPRSVFFGKPVLSISAGGSPGHMLALDYTLKPVLSALGAQHQLASVFASESDIPKFDNRYTLNRPISDRLSDAASALTAILDEAKSSCAQR